MRDICVCSGVYAVFVCIIVVCSGPGGRGVPLAIMAAICSISWCVLASPQPIESTRVHTYLHENRRKRRKALTKHAYARKHCDDLFPAGLVQNTQEMSGARVYMRM